MLVPTEVTPPRHQQHKPLVEARRAQIEHHRDLRDREYVTQNEENRNLRDEVRDLDRIIKLLKEEQRRLQKELLEKTKDNDWLRTLLAEQTAKVKEFEKDQASLKTQLNEAKSQVLDLTAALKNRDETIEGLKQDLVSSMKAHQDALEVIDQKDEQIRNFKIEAEDLKRQRDAANAARDELQEKIIALEAQVEEVGTRADESEKRVKQAQDEVLAAQAKCATLKEKISSMKALDEDGWSGSEDSDGVPKRRKKKAPVKARPPTPPPPEVIIDTAQIEELRALLEAKTQELAEQTERAEKAERDAASLQSDSTKQAKDLREADAKIVALRDQVEDLTKLKSVLSQTQTELAVERKQRQTTLSELAECKAEIERLTAIAQSCEDLAIQIQHFRDQRRVAEEFCARMLHDSAEKAAAAETAMREAQEERDDAVALAGEKSKLVAQKTAEIDNLKQELETSRQSTRLAEQRVAALSKQIEGLQDDVVRERLAKAEADAQKAYIAQEGGNVIDALRIAQAEIARLQHTVDTQQVDLAEVQSALQDSERFRQQLADSANANLQALSSEIERLQQALQVASSNNDAHAHDGVCRDPSHQGVDFAALQREAAAAMEQLQHMAAAQAADRHKIAELEAALQQQHANALNAEQARIALEQEIAAARTNEAATSDVAVQITALKDEIAAKDAAAKKAKADFESRHEKERAEWSAKLRLSEAKRAELDTSLQAKLNLIRQHQDAIIGHEKKMKEAVAAAVEDQKQVEMRLRRELAAAQEQLTTERERRADAERFANDAKSREAATRREADALKETQLHW